MHQEYGEWFQFCEAVSDVGREIASAGDGPGGFDDVGGGQTEGERAALAEPEGEHAIFVEGVAFAEVFEQAVHVGHEFLDGVLAHVGGHPREADSGWVVVFPVELAWSLRGDHEDVVRAPGPEPSNETLAGLAVAVGGDDEGRGRGMGIGGLLHGIVYAVLYRKPVDLRVVRSECVGCVCVVHDVPYGKISERRQCSIVACGRWWASLLERGSGGPHGQLRPWPNTGYSAGFRPGRGWAFSVEGR